MRKKALLVGNDINNATSSYSWSDLLNDLIHYARVPTGLSVKDKPFPLLYEEIYLSSTKYHNNEIALKRYIASKTTHLSNNTIHDQLLQLGIATIFTTNYDLTLEQALGVKRKLLKNSGVVRESLYSLFRYHASDHHNIWHIHGSQLAPNTITLGYEHYSGYLQQMRTYLISGVKDKFKNVKFNSLLTNVIYGNVKHDSWMDYFFTHDVFILGLNLDFVEMHLWWLLTIRTRLIVKGQIDLSNKIYYFYPKQFEKSSLAKLDLLRINGIETIALEMKKDDRIGYYEKVIESIDSTPASL